MTIYNVKLVGFKNILRQKRHNDRIKFKIDGMGKTTNTIVIEIDKGGYNREEVQSALVTDRLVFNFGRIFGGKNISLSSRDIRIIPMSSIVAGEDDMTTGVLRLHQISDKEALPIQGKILASTHYFAIELGGKNA